jgi:hypothetical protein
MGYRILRKPSDDEAEPDAQPKAGDPALLRNEFDQIGKEKTWRSMTDIRTWMFSRNIPQVKLYMWGYAPEDDGHRFLLVLALANLGYAVLILTLLVVQRDALTPLGVAYFGGEVVVLIGLVCLEIRKSVRHR